MFRVHITGKDGAAKRCHLKGDYQLVIKDSSLCLCSVTLGQVIFEWMYSDIRCYGYTDKAFNFEAGRSSSSGEGIFSIKTKDGFEIHKVVDEKVQQMRKNMDAELQGGTHRLEDGFEEASLDYTNPYSVNTSTDPRDDDGEYVNL